MELRQHRRFPVRMRIVLGPPDGPEEEGIVLNISLGGCAIQLSRSISKDLVVILRLFAPEASEPIVIDTAVTRRFKDSVFCVQFLSLTAVNQERLKALIRQLEEQDWGIIDHKGGGASCP